MDDETYLLSSEELDEPFFNRAGFLTCDPSSLPISDVESAFSAAKRDYVVTFYEPCREAGAALRKRGYAVVDRMAVMKMRRPKASRRNPAVIRRAEPREAGAWCDAYLGSFYGDLALKRKVAPIARRVSELPAVTLLVAESDKKVVGVTALFRTPHLLGLYCLGTLPDYRGRGVAHSLVSEAQRIAGSEGRKLVLQALQSESAEPFYLKAGFRRLYTKVLARKDGREEFEPASGGTSIRRDPGVGPHLFTGIFRGFEGVQAVKSIFREETGKVVSELRVDVVEEKGYMHINATKGSIVVSAGYLKDGDEKYRYLDAIHELVHIRQHMEGKELWDRRYKYIDRPTELEAYRVAVVEARRIGLTERELVDYLKVEWISAEDFMKFLVNLGVRDGTAAKR